MPRTAETGLKETRCRPFDEEQHQQPRLQQVPEHGRRDQDIHRLRQVQCRCGLGWHQSLYHQLETAVEDHRIKLPQPVVHRARIPHEQDRPTHTPHLPPPAQPYRGTHLHLLHRIHHLARA